MREYHKEIGSHSQPRAGEEQPAVTACGLTLAHGSRVALADATFQLPAGRVTSLIGPNGSGKSTLLNAIAGLHAPAAGSVQVLDGTVPPRQAVAYVLQALHANEHLPVSVREVVTMGRYGARGPWGRLRSDDRAAVAEAMERLAVADLARRPLNQLSGGQCQRVLVAQALAQRAPVLLLDEPVTGLDIPSQERILQVIGEERAAGHTVVVSTHSLTEAAGADHLLLLAGRVVAQGGDDQVLTEANLREAYGSMVLTVGDGVVMVDDGSHHHGHEHGHDHYDER